MSQLSSVLGEGDLAVFDSVRDVGDLIEVAAKELRLRGKTGP